MSVGRLYLLFLLVKSRRSFDGARILQLGNVLVVLGVFSSFSVGVI